MSVRLLVAVASLTAVVLAVLVVPLGIANARGERRDLEAKVERDAQALASITEDALERGDARLLAAARRVALAYERRTGGRAVVVDGAGLSVVDSDGAAGRSFVTRPEIRTALAGTIATGVRRSATLGTDLLYVAVPVASGGAVHGVARITYPTSALDERVRTYWLGLSAIAAVALTLAVALGVWLARWASRPLVRLEATAVAAAGGNLHARAPVAGPPEVRSVALAFNDLISRLDALLASQQEFVADASHQLKTPLTALRLRLENLERDVAEAGQSDLVAALAEVDRLGELVEGLLALARADAGAAPATSLQLDRVVGERVDAWAAVASERDVELTPSLQSVPAVHAARERVEQVLDNLLANALEASPPGSEVTVALALRGGAVELVVRDRGPGLSDEEKARAFDRFWRKRKGSGSGLGLAIARRLVEADGGGVALRDAPGGGLAAVVAFVPAPRRPRAAFGSSAPSA